MHMLAPSWTFSFGYYTPRTSQTYIRRSCSLAWPPGTRWPSWPRHTTATRTHRVDNTTRQLLWMGPLTRATMPGQPWRWRTLLTQRDRVAISSRQGTFCRPSQAPELAETSLMAFLRGCLPHVDRSAPPSTTSTSLLLQVFWDKMTFEIGLPALYRKCTGGMRIIRMPTLLAQLRLGDVTLAGQAMVWCQQMRNFGASWQTQIHALMLWARLQAGQFTVIIYGTPTLISCPGRSQPLTCMGRASRPRASVSSGKRLPGLRWPWHTSASFNAMEPTLTSCSSCNSD
mmetsp:Transcript_10874/g.26056  ORF Transcript_10874/g.26056 Transcript_10874/m.26056 type:complete len:285 (+) Transcript_10874:627-1481(+)